MMNLADGEDISWIWDIDLEKANREDVRYFIASGKRAYDAALRMKYAGIPADKIMIVPDLEEAVLHAKSKGFPVYIMATYTCLAPMMKILSKEQGQSAKRRCKRLELLLYHFCPDTLNLYGDRGNIICLKKRCEWRGITLQVEEINKPDDLKQKDCDFFMIGGGSDREQAIATNRLTPLVNEIKAWIEDGVAALTICGGYQFLGEYLQTNSGQKLTGMGILPFYSQAEDGRLMTNLLVESEQFGRIVGFENHSGRTYHDLPTLGKVIKGYGNNEKR